MNYSPVIHDHARALYLEGNTPLEIADTLKIELQSITDWMTVEDWETPRRDRLRAEAHAKGDLIIEQEKPIVTQRQIRIAQKLDRHIEAALDKPKVSNSALVNLSKAALNSVSMSESTLGLKKASVSNIFVQFNLKPTPVQDALRTGCITVEELPEEHRERYRLTSGALLNPSANAEQAGIAQSLPSPDPS